MIAKTIAIFLLAVSASAERDETCPGIKSRNNWGARTPTTVTYQTFPVPNVIIHHTVTPVCTTFRSCATQVKSIQRYHQTSKKWPDIAYNFLVGNDGNVYEGVGWHKVGTHMSGYNKNSIGIAFIGDFNDKLPSRAAMKAAQDLIQCGVELGEISVDYDLYAARQLQSTESPGLTLYAEIQDWDNWKATPNK